MKIQVTHVLFVVLSMMVGMLLAIACHTPGAKMAVAGLHISAEECVKIASNYQATDVLRYCQTVDNVAPILEMLLAERRTLAVKAEQSKDGGAADVAVEK